VRRAIIACKVLEAELRRLLPPEVEIRSVDQGLHRVPDRLREALQQEIDSLDADEILLGYGLCGNGVSGLRSQRSRLVVPRADDCISLFLGSAERYLVEFQKEPGTYWFSHGWIEHAIDPLKEYHRCVEQYGEETARWVAHEMMKGYHRVALIDTGVCPVSELREYSRRFAEFFGLEYVEVTGSDGFLRELISDGVRNGRFVVAEPGEAISPEAFQQPLGTANL